jgi:lipopolysaccharide/colanic/teichoic acid biosynthesis glycosyltransferase
MPETPALPSSACGDGAASSGHAAVAAGGVGPALPPGPSNRRGRRLRSRTYEAGKRLFDVVFSAAVLLALLPVLSVLAALVRWTSPGPVLFRQIRIGRGGRPFWIYKFRSMYTDAAPYAVTPEDDARDPRVTPLGAFLRKSALDELPQFFCVLKGDMSIVGPRPEMPFLVEGYTERQRRRLALRPGITGLWQISEARRAPIHANLQYDRYYCLYRSFSLDMAIIAKTALLSLEGIWAMFRGSKPTPVAAPHPRVATIETRFMEQA